MRSSPDCQLLVEVEPYRRAYAGDSVVGSVVENEDNRLTILRYIDDIACVHGNGEYVRDPA